MKSTALPRLHIPSRRRADLANGGYRGAAFTQQRAHIWAPLTDSRRELTSYTRSELVRRARFLRKNVGMIRGVAKSIIDHAVGTGIYPIPTTKDDAWNEAAFNYFFEIAKIADVTGKLTFWELQRCRTGAKFWDGEYFTINTESSSGVPQFQGIRAHNCGNYDIDPAASSAWHDGVRLDAIGRARAYRFRLADDTSKTVPAASVTHSWLVEDSDQVRGVTPLAHAINNLQDILETLGFEKGSVKNLSRTGYVITTESGEDEEEPGDHFTGGSASAAPDGLLQNVEQIFGNETRRLKIGEKLEAFKSDRPSPTFTGFIDYLGRDITTGVGLPYEFAWNPQALAGPSVRFALNKVRNAILEWRENEIQDSIPFYTYAIAKAINNGDLPPNPEWYKAEWLAGAEDPTIDGGRDSAANINDLKAGLTSFKRYFAARGLWWKKELEQKARESAYIDQLAKQYGISADRIHQLAPNNSGQPERTAAEPAAEEEAVT